MPCGNDDPRIPPGAGLTRLDAHLQRFASAAKAIALGLPGGSAAVREIVLETARAFGADDAYLRLIATRGDGPLGIDPTQCAQPRLICIVDRIAVFPEPKRSAGIELLTSSWRRPNADVLDPRAGAEALAGGQRAARKRASGTERSDRGACIPRIR